MTPPIARLLLLVCCSAAAVSDAQAFTHSVPARAIVQSNAKLFGELLASHQGLGLLLRPGTPIRSGRVDGGANYGMPQVVINLADGGVLTLDAQLSNRLTSGTRCQVRRFGPALELRWLQVLEMPADSQEHCYAATEDGAGNLWIPGGGRVTRLSPDGVVRGTTAAPSADVRAILRVAGDPAGAGVYAVTAVNFAQGQFRDYGAARLDATGALLWSWIDADPKAVHDRIEPLDNGGAALEGYVLQVAQTSKLTVLDADGRLRWRYPEREGEVLQHAYGPDGKVLSYARASGLATQAALSFRDADGSLMWSQQRGLEPGTLLQEVQLAYRAGAYLLAERLPSVSGGLGSPGLNRFQRLDSRGESVWVQRRALTPHNVAPTFRADGSVLIQVTTDSIPTRVEVLAAADGTPQELNLATPAADFPRVYSNAADLQGALSLAVGHAQGPQRYQHIDATGRQAWEQLDATYDGLSMVLSGRICASRFTVRDGLSVECRAPDDGRVLGEPLVFGPQTSATLQAVRSDGQRALRLLTRDGSSLGIVRPDGSLTSRSVIGSSATTLERFSAGGELAVLQVGTELPLYRVDSSGQMRFVRSTKSIAGGVLDAFPLDSGETLLRSRRLNEAGTELRLLSASGGDRWTRVFDSPLGSTSMEVLESSDLLVVAAADYPAGLTGLGPIQSISLLALDRTDGHVVWQRSVATLPSLNGRGQLLLETERGRVHWVAALRSAVDVQSFDLASGEPLGSRVVEAPADHLALTALIHQPSRTLRVEAHRQGPNTGTDLLVGERETLDAPPTPGLENSGRIGAWYDPASAGQGLLIDLVPGSRTLYAAWFTFESDDNAAPYTAPGRLRWYSLQGEYVQGAREMTLDVLENRGGQFAQPPATTAAVIGSARLSFSGCSSAVLEVQMEEPGLGPLRQRIALRALAVRDGSCAMPAIAVQQRGFSSAASGSWLDPASGGQGLVAVVQPPAANSNGLFFAGWFHYDPAGLADDPGQQAWLTLQGDLAAALDGTSELGIYRTLSSHLAGPATANTRRIGTATVRLQGCDRMTLSYRFDDGELVAPYRALSGAMQLQKLGGCDG